MGSTVWLASYPKSGNTWFRAVLTAARTGAAIDVNALDGGPIASQRDVADDILGIATSDLTPEEADALRPLVDDALDAERDGAIKRRKVHDDWRAVSVAATRGAVYLVRDPRDVAVSNAHHRGCPLDVSVEQLCDPGASIGRSESRLSSQLRQRLGTWSDHVLGWVDDAPFPVHVVRYEDALADPVAAFGPALRFAGLDVDDGAVARAVEHASFDRLRASEDATGFHERSVPAERFFRRGRAGEGAEQLTDALAERLLAVNGAAMRRFGYAPG